MIAQAAVDELVERHRELTTQIELGQAVLTAKYHLDDVLAGRAGSAWHDLAAAVDRVATAEQALADFLPTRKYPPPTVEVTMSAHPAPRLERVS